MPPRAVAQPDLRRGAASRWASPPSASAAGTAASTSAASRRTAATPRRCRARSPSSTRAGSTREKGADLLADAFLAARERDPRLHLALAGGGPEEDALRERLGEHATFLGWLEGDALANAYASADIFLFASRTDTFGQVLLEAQASGLPVVAVGEGGPTSIVTDGVTGRLCPADAGDLADVVCELAAAPLQRERLARSALEAVRQRTWERSLQRLADGYRRTLDPSATDLAGGHTTDIRAA